MLFKIFSALSVLAGLGIIGWIFIFGSSNPVPYLLIAIGLFLFAIWTGVWYISDQLEER